MDIQYQQHQQQHQHQQQQQQYPAVATVCWIVDGFLQLVCWILIIISLYNYDLNNDWLISCIVHPIICIITSWCLAIPVKNESWRGQYYALLVSLILRFIFLAGTVVVFVLFGQTIPLLFFGANIVSIVLSSVMLIMMSIILVIINDNRKNVIIHV